MKWLIMMIIITLMTGSVYALSMSTFYDVNKHEEKNILFMGRQSMMNLTLDIEGWINGSRICTRNNGYCLNATNVSGAATTTLPASNISSGTFGANTGEGNYTFPESLFFENEICIGTDAGVCTVGTDDQIAIGRSSVSTGARSVVIGASANSSNTDSVVIGDSANALQTFSTAIGSDAITYRSGGIAIGDKANSTEDYGITIGYRSTAVEDYAIVIGRSSTATQDYAIAIGDTTIANAVDTIAIGQDAEANANNQIIIGEDAYGEVGALDSIAIGHLAKTLSAEDDMIAIGNEAEASQHRSIAIGYLANATGDNAITLGYNSKSSANGIVVGAISHANVSNSLVFGYNSYAGQNAQVVGYNNWADTNAVILGYNNVALSACYIFGSGADCDSARAVAIGSGANASGTDAFSFGYNSIADATGSIAIGASSYADSTSLYSTAIGYQTKLVGDRAVSLGYSTIADDHSVAIGDDAEAHDSYAFAMGTNSFSNASQAMCFGYGCTNKGLASIKIGGYQEFTEDCDYSVGVGLQTFCSGDFSVGIGYYSNVSADGSMAIGREAKGKHSNSMAIGREAETTSTNQLMIGSDSYNYNTHIYGNLNTTGWINTESHYLTNGTDYAEIARKADPDENIISGMIVGLHNGKVSKDTENATMYFIVSGKLAGIIAGSNRYEIFDIRLENVTIEESQIYEYETITEHNTSYEEYIYNWTEIIHDGENTTHIIHGYNVTHWIFWNETIIHQNLSKINVTVEKLINYGVLEDYTGRTHVPVAMVGKIKVYVKGTVTEGDWIIPSGDNDGTGIAVDPYTASTWQQSMKWMDQKVCESALSYISSGLNEIWCVVR